MIRKVRYSKPDEDYSKSEKVRRTDELSAPRPAMPLQPGTPLLGFSSYGQQLPYTYATNIAGHGCGDSNTNMQVVEGPFTQSQWKELQLQVSIYKYIGANVAVPPFLVMHIKRSLYPYGISLSSSAAGSLPHSSIQWGTFHQGYANNTDVEARRCNRTDGKNWRCKKDAVPNHKYCEKHSNRGRRRSRNPVEGLATAPFGTTSLTVAPLTFSASESVVTGASGGASNSQCFYNPYGDRVVNRAQGTTSGLSGTSPPSSLIPNYSCFSLAEQAIPVTNPSHRSSYVNYPQEDGSFPSFRVDQESQHQNLLLRGQKS